MTGGVLASAEAQETVQWLTAIKEKYIHGGDEGLDAMRSRAIDTARMAVEALAKQQWVPTSVRLPGKDEYIAKTDDGTEYYVRLLVAYKTDIVEYEIGYYDGYKWLTEMPMRIIHDVIAWKVFDPFISTPEVSSVDG